MKYAWLFVLLALIQVSQPVPRQKISDGKQQDQGLKSVAHRDAKPAANSLTPQNSRQSEVPKQNSNSDANPKEDKTVKVSVTPIDVRKDAADYIMIGANLLLTLATLVIAVYAALQANAALLNAKALINSERPWIFVTAEHSQKIGSFLIRATVKGRTPARVTEIYSHRTFIDIPDNLPAAPEYKLPVVAPKEPLLGDGESFKIAEVNPTFLVDEEWKAKNPNFYPYQFLCFYGIVRYEDCLAAGKDNFHETRWCFAYFADGDNDLHPIGPEEYCRKT